MATQYMVRVTHPGDLQELVYATGNLDTSDPEDTAADAALRIVMVKYPACICAMALDNRGKLVTRSR